MAWGATPDDWLHWDLVLGLGEDLLPVVSNPEAKIAAGSTLKGLGKTPSRYGANREVWGIGKWTGVQATPSQLKAWAREPDYGICVQTRRVRAIDIDVPDPERSYEIASFIQNELGVFLPTRLRAGTGKMLMVVRIEGDPDLGKRFFRLPSDQTGASAGLVEFLATGQQFVAIGTHPSGTRYEWFGGLPDDVPVVALDRWNVVWARAAERFGAAGSAHESKRRTGSGAGGAGETQDDVADWLEEKWESYGYGAGGDRLYVDCPWRDGHSGDSGETEAAWLLAGTEGYERGHFKCMHASCAARTDAQFLAAVGYGDHYFDDVTEVAALYEAEAARVESARTGVAVKPKLPLPGFARNKAGEIEPLLQNVVRAVEHPEACGFRVRYDTFRAELVIASADVEDWRPYRDSDGVQLRLNLAGIGFKPVGRELIRDAVLLVGERLQMDTAQVWLEGLPAWDGVRRVERFFPRYFGTADSAYCRAVSRYAWTAQAGRVMDPGCKADMVPVLQGDQGQRKSSGIAAISPSTDFFAEVNLEDRDDDLSRKMRGLLVGELAELKGLNSRDAESIRAWVTKRHEKWTPKYQEFAVTFPRRMVFYGTVNPKEFLADDTGERRWLPMAIPSDAVVDVEAIERDRTQLWAEALALWRAGGVDWEEAERLARGEHAQFKVGDLWTDKIAAWLDEVDGFDDTTPRTRGGVATLDVASQCLHLDIARIGKREEMRITRILTGCGMRKAHRRVDGKDRKVWDDAT